MFEEARKRNPDLKMPDPAKAAPAELTDEDMRLIKQGVGDKTSRPAGSAPDAGGGEGGSYDTGEQTGSVVTYFEEKGFGFLRPESGGRDIFFHVSRLVEGLSSDLKPGTRVLYQLGMDRTGKMAASSVRVAPPPAA
jgi:CspA family cold shock protein